MNVAAVEQGLNSTATTGERITALIEAGIDTATIAEMTEATSASVRNWLQGSTEPRAQARERLDDLRYAMSQLVMGGLEPDEAAIWMQSRISKPPFSRPFEMLRDEPESVFMMIGRYFSNEVSVEAAPVKVAVEDSAADLDELEGSLDASSYSLGYYADKLYDELGKITHIQLPHKTLFNILERLGSWEYSAERGSADSATVVLTRRVDGLLPDISIPEDETMRRRVDVEYQSVAIRVGHARGDDIRCLIDIERQLQSSSRLREIEIRKEEAAQARQLQRGRAGPKLSKIAKQFSECEGKFANEDDLFTDAESLALSQMIYGSTNDQLAKRLGISVSAISRLLKPVRERTGITNNIDLMITAIALGLADIDHVDSGKTSCLSSNDLQLIKDCYNLDPTTRLTARARQSGPQWSRMYTKLRVGRQFSKDSRGQTVLFALKDSVIELPNPAAIRMYARVQRASGI